MDLVEASEPEGVWALAFEEALLPGHMLVGVEEDFPDAGPPGSTWLHPSMADILPGT